ASCAPYASYALWHGRRERRLGGGPVTAAALLAHAEAFGLRLQLHNGQVRVEGNGVPPDDLLTVLRSHRDDIAHLLALRGALRAAGRRAIFDDDALKHAALQRPPSWWRPEPHRPPTGAWCSCCRLRCWWTRDRMGWCCSTCHPSAGLISGDF